MQQVDKRECSIMLNDLDDRKDQIFKFYTHSAM